MSKVSISLSKADVDTFSRCFEIFLKDFDALIRERCDKHTAKHGKCVGCSLYPSCNNLFEISFSLRKIVDSFE